LYSGGQEDQDECSVEITREKMEELCMPLFERAMKLVVDCMAAVTPKPLTTKDIDEVVLVGGSSRIPKVKQMLDEIFKKKLDITIDFDNGIAMGAGIYAAVKTGMVSESWTRDKMKKLTDILTKPIGILTADGVSTVI
jgi:molecular chaperone DnaK (HSP70)